MPDPNPENDPCEIPQTPPLLEYRSQVQQLPPIRQPFLKFLTGAGLGIILVSFGALLTGSQNTPTFLFAALGVEFVAGIFITIMSRDRRPFGIGLILAVPLAVMIFFVGCAIILVVYK